MTKRRVFTLTAAGLAGLALALTVGLVLTAPDTVLPWSVFGSSGNASSSTSYDLGSTSGQSPPIGESASTSYDVCAGFWCGAGIPAAPATPAATQTPTETPTDTPTATPKNPNGDTDGDTIPNAVDEDDDNDGCSDIQEAGGNEVIGGLRDPHYYWDFTDQWIGGSKDGGVTIGDIGAVVARFGATRDPPPTKEEAFAEALTPPSDLSTYHASADRGPGLVPNGEAWQPLPPDGSITIGDIGAVVAQFGHTCA